MKSHDFMPALNKIRLRANEHIGSGPILLPEKEHHTSSNPMAIDDEAAAVRQLEGAR
ncbi:hypothetical protein ACFQI7_12925 [Paenibacillus allorhizosphaerae]|uniref:Uncharacterized protein n=1 Tax=Paenibacillus allorhizosphaerae TaxID=2849866 RepID=A0ABM8VL80_9BACL|nr:hypothetical protein [Paenibacillus allorhizosphaerae]CAG7648226.1 hypothetical protein PAECIP111802_04156 [Paenibacillus allorhizosphaerae]